MASGPITSWQIDGGTMETVTEFIFGGSKITADSDCSHEIKRRLLLGRKAMINLDSILKSRDISLSAKVRLVKGMVYPVVMYGWECWIIKKAEFWRSDALNCSVGEDSWESLGLQGDPTSPSKENQSWIFIGRTDAEAEYNTLATWCKELTPWKRPWCWERLKAEGEGDNRGRDGWMTSPIQWTWVWVGSGRWWWTGRPSVLWPRGRRVRDDGATEEQRE